MTLNNFLRDIKQRVEKLEQSLNTPDDSILWLRAKDVETSAHHMAREIKRLQAQLARCGVGV